MNRIVNASGLDGTTGWTVGGGLTADDFVVGGPNRIAIVRAADGFLQNTAVVVTPGETVGAFTHHAPGSTVAVAFQTAGSVGIGLDRALTVRRDPGGTARRGVASTFAFSRSALLVPATAAKAILYVQPGPQPFDILFRPFVGDPGECWRPGPHVNVDLPAVTWPAALEAQREGFELEPISLRKSFAGDAGIPTSRRMSSVSRRFATVEFVLDGIGRDLLDQFWRANHDEFFFVRPDNGDLCIAEWADDGDPRDSGAGGGRRTSVRLLLRDS